MRELICQFNATTMILVSLAIVLLAGFVMTRLTKLAHLPNVTGYILAGVLIGPWALGLIPAHMVEGMGFVSDIALAFIAFGVGRFFKKEAFKQTGPGVLLITLLESLLAGALVCLAMGLVFGLDWDFALILGAIATATAPASTMMTIRQYGARGSFVNTLLQVIALDDAVCLVAFSLVAALVTTGPGGGAAVLWPLAFNVAALGAGALAALALCRLMTPGRSRDNRLILTVAFLLAIAGLCAAADVSPLLACMVFGAVYVNLGGDTELFDQVEGFTPPIMSIFFVVSGMSMDMGALGSLGVVGLGYFVIRSVGKYLGAYGGCLLAGAVDSAAPRRGRPLPEASTRKYLGLALVPQAGVAIGLAFLGKRILPDAMGDMLLTIIMASSVLYELVGPACAKLALRRAGALDAQPAEAANLPDPAGQESRP